MRTLFSTIAYGEEYTNIFLNYHLKSFLADPPEGAEFLLFSDESTMETIKEHESFKRLKGTMKVSVALLGWDGHEKRKHDLRYQVLVQTMDIVIKTALEGKFDYCSFLPCDLLFARGYFKKVLGHLEEGYDSVFVHPMRACFESISPELDKFPGTPNAEKLFDLAYKHLHPLWNHCHWNSPQFTRMPDTLLWNSETGLLARTFSITPVIFVPKEKMLGMQGVIDYSLPPLCDNPKWCEDWTDAPLVGIEPGLSWYPPFGQSPSSVEMVRDREKDKRRREYAKHRMYYPNKKRVTSGKEILSESNRVVEEILNVRHD